MSLRLSYDDEQLALQGSIDGYCRRAGTGPLFAVDQPLPAGFWEGLAELGVLGLGTETGGGGALEIVAAMETLGAHGAPGPLVGTYTATSLLGSAEVERIASGTTLVSVGQGELFPWAPVADVFVEIDGDSAWRVEPSEVVDTVETTATEPWGRFRPTRLELLDSAVTALARAEIAIAAYAVGAAQQLLDLAADYARDRVQFNKPIGAFQAVSHPLAIGAMRVNASRILTRGAAQQLDRGGPDAAVAAATARLSAVGSTTAVGYQAHQAFGAIGFTLEGPVVHLSHRIRQVGLLPPHQSRSRCLVLQPLDVQ